MNTRRINSAAEVINAALTQNRTAAGIALALESTGFLVTPELEQIRAQVAELEEQVAALQAQGSVPWQADGITRRLAPTQALRKDDVTPQVQKLRDLLAGQRTAVEDPNGLHHDYRLGRDLPETGGTSC